MTSHRDRSAGGGCFERSFRNDHGELLAVLAEVRDFLEGSEVRGRVAYIVNLAVEEMATNILKYGYDDDETHEIELSLTPQPERVLISLSDDGHPFDPLDAPAPDVSLGPDEREPGGLGIALVRRLAQSMSCERRAGRNHLTITIGRQP